MVIGNNFSRFLFAICQQLVFLDKNIIEDYIMKYQKFDEFVKLHSNKEIDSKEVLSFAKERLSRSSSSFKVIEESKGTLKTKCYVDGTIRIFGIKSLFTVKPDGNTAKLTMEGHVFRGWMFWFLWLIVVGEMFFFASQTEAWPVLVGPQLLLLIIAVRLVEKKPKELVDKIIKELEREYS